MSEESAKAEEHKGEGDVGSHGRQLHYTDGTDNFTTGRLRKRYSPRALSIQVCTLWR